MYTTGTTKSKELLYSVASEIPKSDPAANIVGWRAVGEWSHECASHEGAGAGAVVWMPAATDEAGGGWRGVQLFGQSITMGLTTWTLAQEPVEGFNYVDVFQTLKHRARECASVLCCSDTAICTNR